MTIFAITTATDVALHAMGVYPAPGVVMDNGLFALATLYRVAYGVLGCYVCARLAPRRSLAHAHALGGIGVQHGQLTPGQKAVSTFFPMSRAATWSRSS